MGESEKESGAGAMTDSPALLPQKDDDNSLRLGSHSHVPSKLWLWRNGPQEFWAFRHLYPRVSPGGDPSVLGEPVGYALVKPSFSSDPREPEPAPPLPEWFDNEAIDRIATWFNAWLKEPVGERDRVLISHTMYALQHWPDVERAVARASRWAAEDARSSNERGEANTSSPNSHAAMKDALEKLRRAATEAADYLDEIVKAAIEDDDEEGVGCAWPAVADAPTWCCSMCETHGCARARSHVLRSLTQE